MMRIIIVVIYILVALTGVAQINVSGVVLEEGTNEPLTGASVILRNADGKIRKYATSDSKGRFIISASEINGHTLDVSMMSYAKHTVGLDSVSFPVTIVMSAAVTALKEVAVKADRIREQGDTISYNVGSFAHEQDRSIGDVLKRMPGIDVSNNGRIKYQGEDINKFYIEGSDLLGGKYGIATNGINHDDVGAVEVMENHQPMQVLSGVSFSDKAAINLKLKKKAKATWSFHGDAGGGYSWQPDGVAWDGELFAMAVMPGFQNMTTFKTNNIGEDLSSHIVDFFSSGRKTGLGGYVSVSLPGVPSLSQKRTLFNRSALVSTNSLWKTHGGEFKFQIDYSFNRVASQTANVTTYFLDDGDRVITESRYGRDRSHALSGKFIYEVNNKTAFINNTLQTSIDWDDIVLGMTGSIPNTQSVSLPDYYVSNSFKMIKRFNGRHLVTFKSDNSWESLPQMLDISASGSNLCQHVGEHAFITHESAAYAFAIKRITVSLEGGIKGYFRSMNSDLSFAHDVSELPLDGGFENVMGTNYLTVYAIPKFECRVRRVNLTLETPVSYVHYTFDKALANRSEAYFSPSLSMNWKPNNRVTVGLNGGAARSPIDLGMIHSGYIMTTYRSFSGGVDNFYNSTSQNVSANIAYKHTRRGIFANVYLMHSWSHDPYTMVQQLYGDYIFYSYAQAKSNGQMFMANGSFGKTLDFMRGSANLQGSFSRSGSQLLSADEPVNSVGSSWTARIKINGAPLRWISFDYSFSLGASSLEMNGMRSDWLSNMENTLFINFMPHKKWDWRVMGEHYRNELNDGYYKNVFMIDTKIVYKLSKRFELSATVSNILNERTYNYTSYNQLSSFESKRWLRGRELLFTISIRK